jgi:hypothetical protein
VGDPGPTDSTVCWLLRRGLAAQAPVNGWRNAVLSEDARLDYEDAVEPSLVLCTLGAAETGPS